MPMEILSDTFDFNMFDDIVYDNLHCTNNEVLRSENNNCVTINYDEGKADELLINSEENNTFVPINYDEKKTELFNSKKNIETVTINCDEKKTDELLINSEENNKFVPINYDEKKTELFNSKENIETVTINCDEKKTDELLINSEENNKTETMNSENKAGKSENTINADNSNIIENIRTGIKTSNLTESSIDNIWSTHFPWPKTPSSQGSTKSSERKVPYAITSVQWQEIQKEKECVKLKKQEAIDFRKEERKRKAIEKEITLDEKRKKKNTKKDNVEELEDIKKLIPQTQTSTSKVSKTSSYTVGCFVIVEYEEEYFPGEIMKKKANEYQVRVMCMSGLNWKWPEKEDICWYKKEYVMQSIMPPKLVNARKIYAVPEINNYKI
ncbi:unnamed protein product [Macrosiphum euphorbiae]|nr:unnamed protein product [Macrosiphum euphorbiae]